MSDIRGIDGALDSPTLQFRFGQFMFWSVATTSSNPYIEGGFTSGVVANPYKITLKTRTRQPIQ